MNPRKPTKPRKSSNKPAEPQTGSLLQANEPVRINRFIASTGYCSRRKADDYILAGKVSLNNQLVKTPGDKVMPGVDKVRIEGKLLEVEKPVYVLLNKPKNTITTLSDPDGRKTVGDLLKGRIEQRVFPVGRLDRNTTGILLLTNDGELAKKLTHPKHQVKKVYHVELFDTPSIEVLEQLRKGIELEDGFIKADDIDYVDNVVGPKVGLSIHSGRNRIVRRMFEHLRFNIKNLDRVGFGPINTKGTRRGTWRMLTSKEISQLSRLK